jgi:chaperone required for assembly of F1-ATPase
MSAKKRFYKDVQVNVADGGFAVELDGRGVRSPAGTQAIVPVRGLADAIASEWDAQVETINAASMPLFSLSVTVLDRVVPQRQAIISEMTAYGGNDLLCYQDAEEAALAALQVKEWSPWIDWARRDLGAELVVATGIMPVNQPAATLTAFQHAVASYDDWQLGALHRAVALGGSLVLGLAFIRGKLDAAALFETAFLDELWQSEKWGSDWEAEDRRELIRTELAHAHRFLTLLKTG